MEFTIKRFSNKEKNEIHQNDDIFAKFIQKNYLQIRKDIECETLISEEIISGTFLFVKNEKLRNKIILTQNYIDNFDYGYFTKVVSGYSIEFKKSIYEIYKIIEKLVGYQISEKQNLLEEFRKSYSKYHELKTKNEIELTRYSKTKYKKFNPQTSNKNATVIEIIESMKRYINRFPQTFFSTYPDNSGAIMFHNKLNSLKKIIVQITHSKLNKKSQEEIEKLHKDFVHELKDYGAIKESIQTLLDTYFQSKKTEYQKLENMANKKKPKFDGRYGHENYGSVLSVSRSTRHRF